VLTALLRASLRDERADKTMHATLRDAERIGRDSHSDVVVLRADAEAV
jgi:hypothetical protein